ncbi:MAG TPA: hypothetical protein VL588_06335 [Bdellovibrionota bacterium]|jgi:hypothetical protein|nr:hypothetical protein [Bdellovibrionota bacterium]
MTRRFAQALSLTLLMVAAPLSAVAAQPITSLNDLPREWNGVAGDLLMSQPAKLTIDRIKTAEHTDTAEGFQATYEVDANLTTVRTVAIKSITLDADKNFKNVVWVTINTADELVPTLFAAISYDEASNTYTLKEMPKQGERRFVLKGQN